MITKRLIYILLLTFWSGSTSQAFNNFSAIPQDTLPENIYLAVDIGPENLPSFPGDFKAMSKYIEDSLRYPEKAQAAKIGGRVHLKFVVLEDGSIYKPRIIKGISPLPLDYGLNEEAIRLIQSMPKWNPGTKDGVPVAVYCFESIDFDLEAWHKKSDSSETEISEDGDSEEELKEEEEDVEHVETMPEFPGGQQNLFRFIGGNIRYPPKARDKGIQGTVFIGYVIMEDGSLEDIRIKHGLPYGAEALELEAMRMVEIMPNWIPGTQDGEPVRVAFTLPIRFKVEGLRKPKKKKKKKNRRKN